jgi:hypothetical protein
LKRSCSANRPAAIEQMLLRRNGVNRKVNPMVSTVRVDGSHCLAVDLWLYKRKIQRGKGSAPWVCHRVKKKAYIR